MATAASTMAATPRSRATSRPRRRTILAAGVHLVSLGGDHFVTWPLLQAHAAVHGPLALVQLDAHQDTWSDDGDRLDHGTFVGRAVRAGLIDPARSIQVGIRTHAPEDCGIEIIDGYTVARAGRARHGRARRWPGSAMRPAYLTVDIDCLDPAFAPGTGTPVAGGLSSAQGLMLVRALAGIDWRGMDVVEVAPAYDHADITAIAAATFVQHYLGMLAARRGLIGRSPCRPGRGRMQVDGLDGERVEPMSAASERAERRMSVAEFLAYDDGTATRYELVDGQLVAMNPPAARHADICENLGRDP